MSPRIHGIPVFGRLALATALVIPAFGGGRGVFFDNGAQSLKARNLGLREAAVPIYHRGRRIEGRNHEVIEGHFQVRGTDRFPQIFADLAANTYFRLSYQKRRGGSGRLGTSIIGSPSLRTPGFLDLIPEVRKATVFAEGARQNYRSRLETVFPGKVAVITERRLVSARPNRTVFALKHRFTALSSFGLDTGGAFVGNDRFRVVTFSSMYAGGRSFDADAIRFQTASGAIQTIPLLPSTPRGAHLLPAPVAVGGWVELVKGRGSRWNTDSPTIRIRLKNRAGLRLGVQGFLASSTKPNDDSLSVWLEWMDAPDTIPRGMSKTLEFELTATPPR